MTEEQFELLKDERERVRSEKQDILSKYDHGIFKKIDEQRVSFLKEKVKQKLLDHQLSYSKAEGRQVDYNHQEFRNNKLKNFNDKLVKNTKILTDAQSKMVDMKLMTKFLLENSYQSGLVSRGNMDSFDQLSKYEIQEKEY